MAWKPVFVLLWLGVVGHSVGGSHACLTDCLQLIIFTSQDFSFIYYFNVAFSPMWFILSAMVDELILFLITHELRLNPEGLFRWGRQSGEELFYENSNLKVLVLFSFLPPMELTPQYSFWGGIQLAHFDDNNFFLMSSHSSWDSNLWLMSFDTILISFLICNNSYQNLKVLLEESWITFQYFLSRATHFSILIWSRENILYSYTQFSFEMTVNCLMFLI